MNSKMEDILLCLSVKYKGNFDKIYEAIRNKERPSDEEIIETKANIKCSYVTAVSRDYPEVLKNIDCPPIVLFYYGDLDLLKRKKANVTGSINATDYGKQMTEKIVKELIEDDYVIISGLSKGNDTVAHRTAIENGGKTIAFLPCGIDKCHPEENRDIYETMKNNHLIISEYPFDTKVSEKSCFARKRIETACADALVITESKEGESIIVNITYALDYEVPIFCVPTTLDSSNSWNNELIRNGAYIFTGVKDIKEEMK